MVIGILQFELLIHDAESLKDKRRVVRSVKDRLHREHQVSVAEVADQENPSLAVLGLALVGTDGRHVAQTLDRIVEKIRAVHDAELGDTRREILHGQTLFTEAAGDGDARQDLDDVTRQMLARLEGDEQ
ncbi:MAG: DUF503 domain-containing protein [Leptolyngbya sp. PLA3]|nr:MAG: DUF503 domain-containing protein [Cyanobacteria bacterium CYA]MCE7968599.1 DUF503 domain-containing protein [Leptolyngbya sp. PL-A3]